MKKDLTTMAATIMFCFLSILSFAQEETTEPVITPRWVSDKGYWVAESNRNSPLNHTIWFYNNDNILIYKETLSGTRLNTRKRSVKMKLKKVLESSLVAWEQRKVPEENKQYVATILK